MKTHQCVQTSRCSFLFLDDCNLRPTAGRKSSSMLSVQSQSVGGGGKKQAELESFSNSRTPLGYALFSVCLSFLLSPTPLPSFYSLRPHPLKQWMAEMRNELLLQFRGQYKKLMSILCIFKFTFCLTLFFTRPCSHFLFICILNFLASNSDSYNIRRMFLG